MSGLATGGLWLADTFVGLCKLTCKKIEEQITSQKNGQDPGKPRQKGKVLIMSA
jgi:hypothetical protein